MFDVTILKQFLQNCSNHCFILKIAAFILKVDRAQMRDEVRVHIERWV